MARMLLEPDAEFGSNLFVACTISSLLKVILQKRFSPSASYVCEIVWLSAFSVGNGVLKTLLCCTFRASAISSELSSIFPSFRTSGPTANLVHCFLLVHE